jgi:2',3'-cyclic-nucleotide 2'-phosphodiesterase (5'-nucleotidase family)
MVAWPPPHEEIIMTQRKSLIASLLTAMALSVSSAQVLAAKSVTLMQLGDVHGHMHEHPEIFPDGRIDPESGGIAKLTTLINEVRADTPNSLLLAIGDTTHGSAEMLFSGGELIVPWLNSIGIDAFTPGNWDFGWGPRVYKQRFVDFPAGFNPDTDPNKRLWLAPNNRTTVAWMIPGCNVPGGLVVNYTDCHVTKATFPTVAMNVYNFNEAAGGVNPAQPLGPPVHLHNGKTYLIKEVNGVKVAILGLTSDVVPQQAQAFNTSFRFTMGYKEMPASIAAAQADGADLIVVLSELGLAKNVQMVKEFPEIDVMFSGHTHERTPEAIVIDHGNGDFSLVTESGEDSFLGRLDLEVTGSGKIQSYNWNLIEADSTVDEDPVVEAMVDDALKTFVSGPDHQCHTFGVNAFPFGKGHTLCDPFDTVIGHTDITIQRWNALEDVSNNVMVDAFAHLAKSLGTTDSKGQSLTDANTLSTTNGFRFDIVIPGSDDGFSGNITIGDLYDYYPIGAATALAEYTGGRLKQQWDGILTNVFDPNPYRQRGGWFLGFTNNMHFDINLSDDFPYSISYGKQRLANVTIGGAKVDDSKIYTLASCYPHGNPTDEVCRTAGATNLRFITAAQETTGPTDIHGNRQLDMSGPFAVVDPVVTDAQLPVFDPVGFNNGIMPTRPLFRKVAPDNFVHPVDALRRYLNPTLVGHSVNEMDDGLGRVTVVGADPMDPRRGVPVSEYGGEGIVQPTQGVGAEWLKRVFSND